MIEKLKNSVEFIKNKGIKDIDFGLILGSGLGSFVDQLDDKEIVPYSDIDSFPQTTVKGHDGRLICGTLYGYKIAVLQGRFHLYEGFTLEEVVLPIYLLHYLGVKTLILTTASGGLNANYVPGDFMVFKDFISFVPAIFPDFQKLNIRRKKVYLDKHLIEKIEKAALKNGIKMHKGVFVWVTGPNYETRSEIKFYSKFGDAISMSTVPGLITGYHLGMNVAAISCITNSASPSVQTKTTHQEVLDVASHAGKKLSVLLSDMLANF